MNISMRIRPVRGFCERLGRRVIGRRINQVTEDGTAVEVAYGWPEFARL